jgi:glycine cleavage system H protein
MSHAIPQDLKYTISHEWVKKDIEGHYVVGITDHAQGLLGDLVFVELPVVGNSYEKGDEVAVVESVKAASDVYAPISGEIIAINPELAVQPDLINKEPYTKGWMFKIKASHEKELNELLDAKDYLVAIED